MLSTRVIVRLRASWRASSFPPLSQRDHVATRIQDEATTMPRRTGSLGLIAAVLLSTGSARAQDITSPYRFIDESQALGLFGGYVLTDRGARDLGPKSSPAVGLRYSLRVRGPFVLEGEAAFVPSTRTVLDTAMADGAFRRLGEADLSLALVQAALRFNITGPRAYYGLQPFLLVGGGGIMDVSDSEDAFRDQLVADDVVAEEVVFDFGTSFAAQIGAGIEWFATRRITVRADVRDVFWQIATPAAFRDQNIASEEWLQNFAFMLGLSYRF